jgi:hypothetical protein
VSAAGPPGSGGSGATAAATDSIFLCVYVELAQVEKMADGVDIVLLMIEVCHKHLHPPMYSSACPRPVRSAPRRRSHTSPARCPPCARLVRALQLVLTGGVMVLVRSVSTAYISFESRERRSRLGQRQQRPGKQAGGVAARV